MSIKFKGVSPDELSKLKFYRCELFDEREEYDCCDQSVRIDYRVFVAEKETPKGYWIVEEKFKRFTSMKRRFILKDPRRKKFARTTKKRALECFIYRKKKRIGYLKASIKFSKLGLEKATEIMKDLTNSND